VDLSIVIASYNTCNLTCRCLRSICRQTRELEYEVIVVDNCSRDDTVSTIEREFPRVRLFRNDENRGFAAAQNRGICEARGRYVLILNSDVLLVGNAAKVLVDRLEYGPRELGVAGPQILNPDGTIAPSARRALHSLLVIGLGIVNRHFNLKRILPETLMRRRLGFLLERWHDNYAPHRAPRQVEYVDGMCVMVKREVLEQTGLFDEQFFFDWEIVDLSNRIRASGWKIEFWPEAQVVHRAHSSRRKVSSIIVETHRSELIYYAKYAPGKVWPIRQMVILVVLLRLLLLLMNLRVSRVECGRSDEIDLCREILRVCRHFDVSSVWTNERIPALLPTGRIESSRRIPML
jgi:GT2 family glycosyltransferase